MARVTTICQSTRIIESLSPGSKTCLVNDVSCFYSTATLAVCIVGCWGRWTEQKQEAPLTQWTLRICKRAAELKLWWDLSLASAVNRVICVCTDMRKFGSLDMFFCTSLDCKQTQCIGSPISRETFCLIFPFRSEFLLWQKGNFGVDGSLETFQLNVRWTWQDVLSLVYVIGKALAHKIHCTLNLAFSSFPFLQSVAPPLPHLLSHWVGSPS